MRLLRIIIAFTLTVMVLAYSGGLTIAKHYCRSELVDLAINTELERCNDAKVPSTLPGKPVFEKKSCCVDVFSNFKLDQQWKTSSIHPQLQAIQPAKISTLSLPKVDFQKDVWLLTKPPPLRSILIYKEFERYLI